MLHRALLLSTGILASTVALTLTAASSRGATSADRPDTDPDVRWREVAVPLSTPVVEREFRGVWVASVANIDWPSRRGLTTQEQQAELLAILDRAAALRLNAVVFQVRPGADALYASPHEPWSEYLTGEMGKAPNPYWDPLAFAITEAHRRGMELHAWFNPYRARHISARSTASPQHISRTHPALVKKYGGYLWMDPGERAVQDHSVKVMLDVVKRYDIDGIHIDDYFYPYKERAPQGRGYLDFPDDASWQRYRRNGGTLARDDWRRRNVDQFIERLYTEVKQEKPWVKFGISPFGIWRPGHPESVRGLDAYTELYADARKWVQNGWLDYLAPQLYWPVSAPQQSYPQLLRWWVEQNAHERHIWPGNFTSRVGDPRQPRWTPAELMEQVRLTRVQAGATGNIHFSMKALLSESNGLADPLRRSTYAAPALVPASPWLARGEAPQAAVQARQPGGDGQPSGVQLSFAVANGGAEPVSRWIVHALYGSRWETRIVPGAQRSYLIEPRAAARAGASPLPDQVVVAAVDRVGREGPAVAIARGAGW